MIIQPKNSPAAWDAELKQRYPEAEWYEDGFKVDLARQTESSGFKVASIQKKPWGREIWLFFLNKYALKLLIIFAGHRFSLQKHERKTESWLVQAGHPRVTVGEEQVTATPGQLFHVAVQTVHRVEAVDDDVELLEVSTPELDDVVRLQDDFDRA